MKTSRHIGWETLVYTHIVYILLRNRIRYRRRLNTYYNIYDHRYSGGSSGVRRHAVGYDKKKTFFVSCAAKAGLSHLALPRVR